MSSYEKLVNDIYLQLLRNYIKDVISYKISNEKSEEIAKNAAMQARIVQKNYETLLFVCKVVKFTKDGKKCYENNLYSKNIDVLIHNIVKTYNVILEKNPEDEFPYFTDGGFKYSGSDNVFNYEFTCHIQKLID